MTDRRQDITWAALTLSTSGCLRCADGSSHPDINCPRLAEIKRLYDVDPGLNLDNCDKILSVEVSVPEGHCEICRNSSRISRFCTCRYISKFSDVNLQSGLRNNISNETRCGYREPTKIQKYVIPLIGDGLDVLVEAPERIGTTVAYMIPLLNFVLGKGYENKPVTSSSKQTPEVLILAPDKDTVMQIKDCALKLLFDQTTCSIKTVFSGRSGSCKVALQAARLRKGCNILIGTPGRVKTLVERGVITLTRVEMFVLDRAEKMTEPGVCRDLEDIEKGMKSKESRSTFMFCGEATAQQATSLQEIARIFLKTNYRKVICNMGPPSTSTASSSRAASSTTCTRDNHYQAPPSHSYPRGRQRYSTTTNFDEGARRRPMQSENRQSGRREPIELDVGLVCQHFYLVNPDTGERTEFFRLYTILPLSDED